MGFWKEVFSDGGQGSASRVMMMVHALAGVAWGTHVVVHTHAIPDPATMAGLTGFICAPYGINSLKSAAVAFAPKGGNGANPNPGT